MEKEVYDAPKMEVVAFDAEDAIRTSIGGCGCDGYYDEAEG